MRGQCTRSARARKRGDHAHTCSTLWLGVPRIFLIVPLSYDAVAFYLNRGEQRLRYEKLAISSYRTSPCPSAVQSANWAIIVSLTASYGCSTQGCSGSACLCQQTPLGNRPFTTRPSTKSLLNGPMMGRSGKRSWPVWRIYPPRSTSISACSMATGPTPSPKKGGWHRVLGVQTPEGGESHSDNGQ